MKALRLAADRLLEVPVVYRAWQSPFANAKLRPFLRRVDLSRVQRVLDVGCGPGTNAPVFAGAEYVGIDVNADYIASAARRYTGRFVAGDVTDERVLPAETFDCVLANSLLHHLPTPDVSALLGGMACRVAPGGEVHILDLVLPPGISVARTLALLDRGRYPRSIEEWRALFSEHLIEHHFESYALRFAGLPLWNMVYFAGVPR